MSSQENLRPVICIDLKKNRIRIHKQTLKMLGNPAYIQLLVNPNDARIAIRPSTSRDHLAHHIKQVPKGFKHDNEIYSADFIKALNTISFGWESDHMYRIYGKMNQKENIVYFDIKNMIVLEENGQNETHAV